MRPAVKKSYAGYSMTTTEWAKFIGIKTRTLAKRFRKMGIDGAITYQIKKRLEQCNTDEKGDLLEILNEEREERDKRRLDEWAKKIDDGVYSWQFAMVCRGYFRKENRVKIYKMLNTWYKEFRSQDMKAA